MTTIDERIAALADALAEQGELTDAAWRSALHAVPRHQFIPDVAWVTPYVGDGYRIDRAADPEAWLEAVYTDQAIITQLSDGATDIGTGEGEFTSSASAPGVLVEFLELLDPYLGDEVLEIGTGTGWTAALLSHRLGDGMVTSVEVDPVVAEGAAAALKQTGYGPRLIVGDGAKGCPEGAPYDRVHVTCGVSSIPYAWVEQTRPGGIIALPWMPAYAAGHKLVLTAVGDGRAVGRFRGGCSYMMMRAQRPACISVDDAQDWRESVSRLDPRRVWRAGWGLDVAVAGMLPDVSSRTVEGDDGSFTFWLSAGDSDASVTYAPGCVIGVRERGPRDLWAEVADLFGRWVSWGSPSRERFGSTVSPVGQHVWLDSPERVLTPDAG